MASSVTAIRCLYSASRLGNISSIISVKETRKADRNACVPSAFLVELEMRRRAGGLFVFNSSSFLRRTKASPEERRNLASELLRRCPRGSSCGYQPVSSGKRAPRRSCELVSSAIIRESGHNLFAKHHKTTPKQKAKTISIFLLTVFAFFAHFYFNDFELTITSSIKPYSLACWAVM